MVTSVLDKITCPHDLKGLSQQEMRILAEDIRAEIIASTSRNGGHIAPSLGAVELILAAHRVMDCPQDKIIFDVGHQAYAHKIITGRADQMYSLRQLDGLSGFPKRRESIFDVHDSGHASDALATALGLSIARDLEGGTERILAIVGDAAMSGGMAFEALNEIGQLQKRMVIILNDNEMSISPSVGALSNYLTYLRTSEPYMQTRDSVEAKLQSKLGYVGGALVRVGEHAKDTVKQLFVPGMFFEELGIKYLGPIDGHNLPLLEDTLERAFHVDGPVMVHAITQKGKGYTYAEKDSERFHGISPFNSDTGAVVKKANAIVSYTKAFADQLIEEAAMDEDIFAITAAMPAGTGLDAFEKVFPDRFLDVGIAEQCAVTTASGLAIGGKLPVVAIYSTFLQRAFDQIAINVCEQNLHVVFAVDRAGLVGEDGPTHHGVFDLSYLRCLPNMKIISPSNESLLKDAIHTALRMDGPVAVRYPRGSATGCAIPALRTELEEGKAIELSRGKDIQILAIGRMVNEAKEAAELLKAKGIDCGVTDMLWVKPLDDEAVNRACESKLVVTIEEGNKLGGFSAAVLESMADQELCAKVFRIGIEDTFVEQGKMNDLLKRVGLDAHNIANRIEAHFANMSQK